MTGSFFRRFGLHLEKSYLRRSLFEHNSIIGRTKKPDTQIALNPVFIREVRAECKKNPSGISFSTANSL